jgi:hypothetical protein
MNKNIIYMNNNNIYMNNNNKISLNSGNIPRFNIYNPNPNIDGNNKIYMVDRRYALDVDLVYRTIEIDNQIYKVISDANDPSSSRVERILRNAYANHNDTPINIRAVEFKTPESDLNLRGYIINNRGPDNPSPYTNPSTGEVFNLRSQITWNGTNTHFVETVATRVGQNHGGDHHNIQILNNGFPLTQIYPYHVDNVINAGILNGVAGWDHVDGVKVIDGTRLGYIGMLVLRCTDQDFTIANNSKYQNAAN